MRMHDFKPGKRVCFAKLINGYVLSDGILLNEIKEIEEGIMTYVMGTNGKIFSYPLSELSYIDSKNNVIVI